jgi:hypothetical protein
METSTPDRLCGMADAAHWVISFQVLRDAGLGVFQGWFADAIGAGRIFQSGRIFATWSLN